ncbi:unnamed protein product [Camellia sinensis]
MEMLRSRSKIPFKRSFSSGCLRGVLHPVVSSGCVRSLVRNRGVRPWIWSWQWVCSCSALGVFDHRCGEVELAAGIGVEVGLGRWRGW